MHRIIIIVSFLWMPLQGFGQWGEACPDVFYLLRNDTVFALNIGNDGALQFIPQYINKELDSVGALAMSEGDWYGIKFTNAHIVKISPDSSGKGIFEDLGMAYNEKGDSLPNHDLTSAIVVDHEMYVLSYSTNSIYGIDLKSKPLRFREVRLGMPFALPNTLAYHPIEKRLYILEQSGRPITIEPEKGDMDIAKAAFANFPRRPLISYGKLWFGRDGRCFLLTGITGTLYELDTKKMVAYRIRTLGFNSTKDAVYCPDMNIPAFLEPDLLEIWVHGGPNHQSLELEWEEGNSFDAVKFFHSERLNRATGNWEPLSYVPGYTGTIPEQALHYNALDRNPQEGENCYRLRIEYYNGAQRFSRTVCMDYSHPKKEFKKPTFRLSPELLSQRGLGSLLQISGAQNKLVKINIYRIWDGVLCGNYNITPMVDDYALTLPLPNMEGWYALRVACGAEHQWFKVFLH